MLLLVQTFILNRKVFHCFYNYINLYCIASQFKSLIRILPFAIGNYVEEFDEHWHCFLLLWDICNMALAFEVTEEDAGHLSWLVETFLESFSILYSGIPIQIVSLYHFYL